MKKIKYILFAFIFFFLTLNVNAESFDKNTMDIYIDNSGDAHITEVWTGYFDKNTELYKAYNNLGKSKIKNLKVSMNGKEFKNIWWNTKKTFDEKKYKSGINKTDTGVELCFGISEYGHNTYTFTYDITNFVVNTTDYQMIYWDLLHQSFNSYQITIYSDFKYKDILLRGYGNYGGLINLKDGKIILSNSKGLKTNEYMVLLARFNKDTFKVKAKLDKDFNTYYSMAEDGAIKYEVKKENKMIEKIKKITSSDKFIIANIYLFFIVIITILVVLIIKEKKNNSYYNKELDIVHEPKFKYYRDIPCNNDLYKIYYISYRYLRTSGNNLLGAIMLKWILYNNITITKENIIFNNKNNIDNQYESDLYDMFNRINGNVLLLKELKKWYKSNYRNSNYILSLMYNKEKDSISYYVKKAYPNINSLEQLNLMTNNYLACDIDKLRGLYNYLNDFSRMYEKMPIDVHLWKEYLIIAQIFGLADKVRKEFKFLYPDLEKENIFKSIDIFEIILDSLFDIEYNDNVTKTSGSILKDLSDAFFNGSSSSRSSGGGGSGSFGSGSGGSR